MRIAALGFRSMPPSDGSAGADKFALELLTRLAKHGHTVTAYTRLYPGDDDSTPHTFRGVHVHPIRTVKKSGFDTLLHSMRATWHIIRNDTADFVHIQNGGNSVFAIPLRLMGKKTFLSQDGPDWERPKWPWYAKLYLRASAWLTSRIHTQVIFDNTFAQEFFEQKFGRKYTFIPFGADVEYDSSGERILSDVGLVPGKYLLFVGRFIPDKGLHYLIEAFRMVNTDMKLVLVGGSPNPDSYEAKIRNAADPRVLFPGYVYGAQAHALMKNCYAYIQPSDVEGLSPVILESSFLGAPVICSDIEQNVFILRQHGIYFKKSNVEDLAERIAWSVTNPIEIAKLATEAYEHVSDVYSWSSVVEQHIEVFQGRSAAKSRSDSR